MIWPLAHSLRAKLLAIILVGILLPFLVGIGVAARQDIRSFWEELESRTQLAASIVADYSAADLAFEDADSARRTLSYLTRWSEVQGASLYSLEGKQFARYVRDPGAAVVLPERLAPQAESSPARVGAQLVVTRAVTHDGRRYGTVYLVTSTDSVDERVRAYSRGVLLVIAGIVALSLGFAYALDRLVVRPLKALTDAARALARTENYGVRVPKLSRDEIGLLADSFNAMVAEVEKRQREAQAAVHIRDEFLSIAAHELRTPMTAFKLQIDRLRNLVHSDGSSVPDPALLSRSLESCAHQIRRLDGLVGHLLDTTRLAAGRFQLERHEVDLSVLARDVAERFGDDLARARCEFHLDVDGPVVGRWDEQKIDQVLTNLLSNAIKYGAGKPIRVAVEGDGIAARLIVEDQGIGIRPEDHSRLFTPFQRLVSARHYGGLGLGLYITHQIVAAHGGTITLRSTPGKGATFTVELPYRLTGDQPIQPPPAVHP